MPKTLLALLSFFLYFPTFAQSHVITVEEISSLVGKWEGTLTYRDYTTGKPFTMPAVLEVKEGKNNRQLLLQNSFPKEPKANSKSKIVISKEGTAINKISIVQKKIEDERLILFTEFKGKDGNDRADALIRNSYIIGTNDLILRKEVKFLDSDTWILRNEYSFKRLN